MTAGVDRRAGRRANDGGEGPPHDARPPSRGDWRADARTTREAAGSVKKPANHAGVGVEAHGIDDGGGRRKPDYIDGKTKKETPIKATGEREKTRIKGSGKKDSLSKPQRH